MKSLKLYIGNKNYSSWSLRPWLLLKHFDIPFEEINVNLAELKTKISHTSGLVPCLYVDNWPIWDSLAIAEYLAEQYPHYTMWPKDEKARARARSISAEMHSGFSHLRNVMGMNIKMQLHAEPLSKEVAADVNRIIEIWENCFQDFEHLSNEPYLFGAFSIADAMFAPVIWRFYSYNVPLPDKVKHYMNTMLNHPAMQLWKQQALAETIVLEDYDAAVLAQFKCIPNE